MFAKRTSHCFGLPALPYARSYITFLIIPTSSAMYILYVPFTQPQDTHSNLSSQHQQQCETPKVVNTTVIFTGTPSRNVPKTVGGQWQAVTPTGSKRITTTTYHPTQQSVMYYTSNASAIYSDNLSRNLTPIEPATCHVSYFHCIHNLTRYYTHIDSTCRHLLHSHPISNLFRYYPLTESAICYVLYFYCISNPSPF